MSISPPESPELKVAGDVLPAAPPRRLSWLFRPVRLSECRGVWQFLIRILAQMFAVHVAAALPLFFVANDAPDPNEALLPHLWLAVTVIVLIAPLSETLLLQAAPIEASRALRASYLLQFLLGSVPFAALHFLGGVAYGIGGGTICGPFLSHAYLQCRSRSAWTSFWVTAVIHGLHNLILLPLLYASTQ